MVSSEEVKDSLSSKIYYPTRVDVNSLIRFYYAQKRIKI